MSQAGGPSEYIKVLAEVIASPRVGGLHLRRVGELLVAREELNERFLDAERRKFSDAEFDDIVIKSSELDDEYVRVWRACEEATREWRHSEGLPALALALKQAADYYRGVASAA
ncbi:hypothetical protein [Streptomyces sp. Isolate_45]|uniref:hypothetical protein n=1 Tax=unclassified Streptomyces TaxID=2593676 RepID=UPI002481CF5A|nr:hypothetical protein [Streptomyces sp. Isolate_45]MDA5281072.1 hypothetical protein [Streptomyces sp. Isolate_45]